LAAWIKSSEQELSLTTWAAAKAAFLFYEDLKMDNDIARIIGGCFIALLSGLGDDIAKAATDCLHSWAGNPDFRPEDRRIYRCIADAASRDFNKLRAENARFDWLEANPRPSLRVVGGTAFKPA
jgi:hypothetical protein